MTHHCAKYHLENLGNYWGVEADLRLCPFKFWGRKTKKVKETLESDLLLPLRVRSRVLYYLNLLMG